jgi:forkhead protein FKH
MMESTEEIDYSVDSAKDIKPPHSYASMIGQAILSNSEENATLSKIYEYIKDHYAFFRHNGGGWQVCNTL